jgi:deazaflavin-dependent oxidoreductase (nitroreductase family)
VPLPAWLARANRRLTNPLLAPAAARLPYFAVILHRGRVSGRPYRTPVNAFPSDRGFIVALTYGRSTDWVRNVMVSGGCDILHRGRRVSMVAPRLVRGIEAETAIPTFVRFALDVLRVQEFLRLDTRRG